MKAKMQASPLSGMYRRHQCQAIPLTTVILQSLRGDVPQACLEFLRKGEFSGYVSMKVDPSTFTDASEFRDAYLATEILSKYPSWDLGIDRVAVALEKFLAAERDCEMARNRLVNSYGKASTTLSVASVIYTAQRKIARLLGPFDWDQASQFFAFGPGASYALKRRYGDAYHKFGCKPEVTKECAVLAHAVFKQHPGWFNHLASISGSREPHDNLLLVEGNRITTVPKNAKTDRVIAIEPLMNMFVQKGIGSLIRRRLKRVGIDLDDQTRNQKLAREGSISGQLATIDLSSASDTVSLKLVEELLPPDWFAAIELARSPVGVLPDGSKVCYQKVSSMGNGFTFELESLIFFALSSAVCLLYGINGSHVSVYGDDIIIPVEAYAPVVEILEFAGFTVNSKKSFAAGPFRESCGKHYFMGHDVSPFYIREDIVTPDRLILALNNLRRFSARLQPWGLDGRFRPAYDEFRHMLPSWFRKPRIPDGYGDGALFGDFSEVLPRAVKGSKLHRGWEGWEFSHCVSVTKTSLPSDEPILLKALYRLEKRVGPHRDPYLRKAGDPLLLLRTLRELGDRTGEDGDLIDVDVAMHRHKPCYQLQKSVAPQWEDKGDWL